MSGIEEINIPANTTAEEPIDVDASMVEPVGNASLSSVEAEVCATEAYGRKPKSVVWSHFSKISEKGSKKAKGAVCNHCKKPYAWVSENGTSSLKKHMLKCTKNPHNKEVRRQKTLALYGSTKEESESALGLWKFDQNACRDTLARMIIKDELPFKFVEREGFRYFCSLMQPNFKKVSRNTAARECVALYSNEKKKLKTLFKKSSQRLCLTTDTWTSLQNFSYMVLTAHFINNDWKLHKRILNFCVISSHKGEAIGKALEACLLEWGVERLCTLTVDNASANDVAVTYLKRKFSKKSDTFILGGQFFHVRCCAHIINLIVKDGLSEIKDEVSRIRDAVKYVRSSPQREQRFKVCVEKERITSKSSLCLDVPTRWNSTFLMLSTALKFQKAFERLEDEDPLYLLDLSGGCPTTKDWDSARYFADFLQKFYDATVHLSGSLYVTSNMYFTEACAIEGFLLGWGKDLESLNDVSIRGMAQKMKAKFDKYWGKMERVNMLMVIASVLDPRLKLRYVEFCYAELYGSDMVEGFTTKVRDALKRIYDEYEKFNARSSSSSQTSIDMEVDQPCLEGIEQTVTLQSKFQKHLEEVEIGGRKSEVDKYLEEACEKETPNFDILNRWKVNASKYNVLSEIARDVLAIPVSTVSSEAAFSTGGRVIDQFRSSLTPKLVECLICMQDWLRATPLPYEVEESMAKMEDLELLCKKLLSMGSPSKSAVLV